MASARHNRKRKHGRRRMGLLFKLLCGAALAAALTVGATVFFQVETIAVVGSSRYTSEEVIAASGVAVGDNLFRMSKTQVSQRIRQQLPQIAQENTFVYTFAAPAALTAADRPDLQADYDNDHTADGGLKTDWDVSNIFNIISSGDIVARVMPEEWGYHRNGNDRFLPSTAYQNELDDLSIIESRMGGVPLRFDQLATKEDVDSVIAAALAFCKSAANYHEKYEAAFMDMLQCAFTLSEKEAAEGVILDDEAVMERLRSMENIRKMSWTKVLRCVMTASAMSRPILEQVGAIVPLRAQQVVVPVLAVGLCHEVESDVLRMLVYYILSLMSVNSPADSVLRAAFCHYPENYITLMEYYDPAEHGMEAYTRK